jgi:ABC-type multidrug transport system fused ATPase/permease subunit
MDELKKVKRVITRLDPQAPQEILLVLDANQGQNALAQARSFTPRSASPGWCSPSSTAPRAAASWSRSRARCTADPLHRRRREGRGLRSLQRPRLRQRAHRWRRGRGERECQRAGSRRHVIRFERVTKRYPNGREALSELSFEVAEGEMVFLTGRSGAGKSTVLKLIALLERPTRGQVSVNGRTRPRCPCAPCPRSAAASASCCRITGC